jgi:hypothetical protein
MFNDLDMSLMMKRKRVKKVGTPTEVASGTARPAVSRADRNPYTTPSGEAWLRPSWVVYLDILGFRQTIRDAAESGRSSEHLEQLRSALNEAKKDLLERLEMFDDYTLRLPDPYVVKVFTDNVVLGFPVADDGESEFGQMISIVGLYQYTLLKHGFFVRGGISFGNLYMDEDVVYGEGLLDAYEAESTLARDPRIVLASSAMNLVYSHLAYYDKVATSPHNEHLLVDSDSQMFVNYLAIPIDGIDPKGELPSEYMEWLRHHRDLVVTKLSEFSRKPTLWSKYVWVGVYHNVFCTQFISRKEPRVSDKLLTQPARRLAAVYRRNGGDILKEEKVVGSFKSMFAYKKQRPPTSSKRPAV